MLFHHDWHRLWFVAERGAFHYEIRQKDFSSALEAFLTAKTEWWWLISIFLLLKLRSVLSNPIPVPSFEEKFAVESFLINGPLSLWASLYYSRSLSIRLLLLWWIMSYLSTWMLNLQCSRLFHNGMKFLCVGRTTVALEDAINPLVTFRESRASNVFLKVHHNVRHCC